MPITDTLRTAEQLRRVGFTEEQAILLSAKYEETAQALGQDLKEFIREQNSTLRTEIRADSQALRAEFDTFQMEMRSEHNALRAELHSAMRDQLMKFIAVMAMIISLAVAIIKLFPNAG